METPNRGPSGWWWRVYPFGHFCRENRIFGHGRRTPFIPLLRKAQQHPFLLKPTPAFLQVKRRIRLGLILNRVRFFIAFAKRNQRMDFFRFRLFPSFPRKREPRAGTYRADFSSFSSFAGLWIPAFAGMTTLESRLGETEDSFGQMLYREEDVPDVCRSDPLADGRADGVPPEPRKWFSDRNGDTP